MTRQVVIAGASGFLGGHLAASLQSRGHRVIRLVRRPAENPAESQWDPYSGSFDHGVIGSADAVVNLAGSPLIGNPYSRRWRRELHRSRMVTTSVLAEAVARHRPQAAYLAGNGIGWYGDQPDPEVDERTPGRDGGLMTDVCRDWQDAASAAVEAGARVCYLRTAPVMDRRAPPLKQLRLLFRAGLGARISDGRQRMPMVSLRDWVDAATWLIEHDDVAGPINLCCPNVPTNREFTEVLARRLDRRARLAIPRPAVKAAGPLAPELLRSLAPRPTALLDTGYSFSDPDVAGVLATGLSD